MYFKRIGLAIKKKLPHLSVRSNIAGMQIRVVSFLHDELHKLV